MSKRWKVRKQNAAKREKSREVLEQFYDNVLSGFEKMKEEVAKNQPAQPAQPAKSHEH